MGNYAGLTSTAGFKFPLLENPRPVIGAILTGQTETMFSFSTGRQHFELAPSVGVGIKDLFGVFLSAGIIFDANLTMGYDTAGLIAFAADPTIQRICCTASTSTTASTPPRRRFRTCRPSVKTGLYLQGFMELSGRVIACPCAGGLYANVNVELVNTDASSARAPGHDAHQLGQRRQSVQLSGKVYASADISLELPNPIGPDITLFSYNLAYDELLNFDPPPPPSPSPPHGDRRRRISIRCCWTSQDAAWLAGHGPAVPRSDRCPTAAVVRGRRYSRRLPQ